MTDKKIVQYFGSHFHGNPVGENIFLKAIDHPNFPRQHITAVITSVVLAYDEATGHIETENTLYVPEGTVVSDIADAEIPLVDGDDEQTPVEEAPAE